MTRSTTMRDNSRWLCEAVRRARRDQIESNALGKGCVRVDMRAALDLELFIHRPKSVSPKGL